MMNSFPPLIPVPVAPTPKTEDELESKFATLFSPPTPRASPDLPIFKPQTRSIEQREAPSSPDSEFGSFVSVPPSEDPLAAPPSFGSPIVSSVYEATSSSSRPRHLKNPSLSFFDSFAQEAKAAHERNKRDVMDELLREDSRPRDTTQPVKNTGAISESLLDLDLDFFTPKHESFADEDYISQSHLTPTHIRTSSTPHFPTRQSTLSLPHGPAPPVASTSTVSSSPPDHSLNSESMTSRSPSYQTLSHISSKWMSSMLKSSPESSSGHLESEHSSRPSTSSSLSSSLSRTRSSSDFRNPRQTQSQPSPASLGSLSSAFAPSLPHTISAPRGAHASPFAPHVFVAPSGAPGFKPDGYDWDKGYSGDLDRELLEGEFKDTYVNESNWGSGLLNVDQDLIPGPSTSHSQPNSRMQTPSINSSMRIGDLIEKKTGNLELKGRREATVAVLDVELAEMIRTQLPALARLPRSWNLLYSLDQHGISLHTLYDKCDNQPHVRTSSGFSVKVGALVVMKDSGDAVFGMYLGDGLRQSKGKGYYGSGESFLWRYVGGKFQVFKWTGKNEYVALCEPEYLSFGGGDGAYGLYLDDSLFDGSSARCPTFDNEPLCSPGVKKGRAVAFECVGLEVWGLGP